MKWRGKEKKMEDKLKENEGIWESKEVKENCRRKTETKK